MDANTTTEHTNHATINNNASSLETICSPKLIPASLLVGGNDTFNPTLTNRHSSHRHGGVGDKHTSNDSNLHRPWYKRRRNYPMIIALSLLFISFLLLIIFSAIIYRKQISSSTDLLTTSPIPTNSSTYLHCDIKLGQLDLETGVGQLIMYQIIPMGELALSPGSTLLKQSIDIFVNGNQLNLPGQLPAPSLQTEYIIHPDLTEWYPFDKHNTIITMYAMSSSNSTTSSNQNSLIPLRVNIMGNNIPSIMMNVTLDPLLASMGMINAHLQVSRSYPTKAYSGLIYILLWCLTISGIIQTFDVIHYQKEFNINALMTIASIILALFSLRNTQLNASIYGTMSDITGYYWNIIILCILLLIMCGLPIIQHSGSTKPRLNHNNNMTINPTIPTTE